MLRPGLDTNRQMLEVTTGPAYMRFVSALPGVDPDVIAGNKPRRAFPPQSLRPVHDRFVPQARPLRPEILSFR